MNTEREQIKRIYTPPALRIISFTESIMTSDDEESGIDLPLDLFE